MCSSSRIVPLMGSLWRKIIATLPADYRISSWSQIPDSPPDGFCTVSSILPSFLCNLFLNMLPIRGRDVQRNSGYPYCFAGILSPCFGIHCNLNLSSPPETNLIPTFWRCICVLEWYPQIWWMRWWFIFPGSERHIYRNGRLLPSIFWVPNRKIMPPWLGCIGRLFSIFSFDGDLGLFFKRH